MFVKQFNDFPNSFNSLKMRFVLFCLDIYLLYMFFYFIFFFLRCLYVINYIISNHIKCVKWKSFNLTMRMKERKILEKPRWSNFEWKVTKKRYIHCICVVMLCYVWIWMHMHIYNNKSLYNKTYINVFDVLKCHSQQHSSHLYYIL